MAESMENTADLSENGTQPLAGSGLTASQTLPPKVVKVAALSKVTGTLLALGCVTMLVVYFNNLWTKEYYQFYPLALVGAGFLGWLGWKEVPKPLATGAWWVTAGLLLTSFTVLGASTLLWSGWLGAVGALVLGLAVAWWLGGWRLTRAMLPAWFMSLTVMRPPMNLDGRLTTKLQEISTKWSSIVLDGFGVTHALSGNVIEIPKQRLMVEEACSGINSILSTTAVCLFFCLWQRRRIWHILVMLVMTVGFVLLGNVTRIVSGAWMRYEFNINILSGWKHETIGLVLFACYLGLIMSADQLLLFLFGPGRRSAEDRSSALRAAKNAAVSEENDPRPVQVRRAAAWPAWAVALVFAALGAAQVTRGSLVAKEWYLAGPMLGSTLTATFKLPDELAGWRRVETSGEGPNKIEIRGVHSQSWHYRRGNDVVTVALDYPFKGYHDVTLCYTGNGWEAYSQRTRQPSESPDGIPCLEVKMMRTMGARASLWFSTMDQKGQWLEGSYVGRTLMERFREQTSSTTFRIQALITSYLPLSTETEASAASLFRGARKLLAEQLMAEMRSK